MKELEKDSAIKWTEKNLPDLSGKTIIITGANSGDSAGRAARVTKGVPDGAEQMWRYLRGYKHRYRPLWCLR